MGQTNVPEYGKRLASPDPSLFQHKTGPKNSSPPFPLRSLQELDGLGGMRGFSMWECQCLTEQRTSRGTPRADGRPVPARGGPFGPPPLPSFRDTSSASARFSRAV